MSDTDLSDKIEQLKKIQKDAGEDAGYEIGLAIRDLESLDDCRSLRDKGDALSSASRYLRDRGSLPESQRGWVVEFSANLQQAADELYRASDLLKRRY